jgi:hypothetical protein
VCRFYRTPGAGDSHFYSAIKAECDAILANPRLAAGWILESDSVFYIRQPDPVTGQCAQGTRPIWRFYNQRTINLRYTTEQAVRDAMRADPLRGSRKVIRRTTSRCARRSGAEARDTGAASESRAQEPDREAAQGVNRSRAEASAPSARRPGASP